MDKKGGIIGTAVGLAMVGVLFFVIGYSLKKGREKA
jgi:transketolase C-terminal domain/subunit